MTKPHFYCGKLTALDFSIDYWNEAWRYCEDNNIEGIERDKILHPENFPCETQCFRCMAEVGERQLKTKSL